MATPNLNRSLPSPPRVSRPPWSPPPPAPEALSNATTVTGGGGRGRPAPPRVASSSPVPVTRAGTTIGLPSTRPLPPVNTGVRSSTVSASAPTSSPISRSLPTPPPHQSGSRPPPRSAPPSPAPVTASSDSRVPPKPVMTGRAPSPITPAHSSSSLSSSSSFSSSSSPATAPPLFPSSSSTSATAPLPAFSSSLQRPKPAETSGAAASQPPNVLVPVPQRPVAFPAPSNGPSSVASNGSARPPAKPAPLPPAAVGAPTPPVAAATTPSDASAIPPPAMPPPQPKFPATAGTRPGSWRASSSASSMSTYAASPSAANGASQLSDNLKKCTSFYHSSPPVRPSMPSIAGARSSLSSSSSSIPSFKSMTSPTIARNSAIAPTRSASPEPEDAQAKKDRLRAEAVKELMFTEQDYINDLELVNEIFLKTLAARNILERQELAALFSNMEMLVGVNQEILKGLKDDPQGDHIGQTFLGVMHYFKMYTVYCANQPHSDNALQKCKSKNSAFAAFLDECMADPRCRGLTLQSYLIKPIQRLCKYPLLLKTICNNTGEGHADHGNLREALAQMEKIVEYVNEGKRHAENSHKIMEIQSNIDSGETLGLVQPTRRLVLEGTFGVRLPRSKEFKDRYCVLFNDLFLCVKTRKKGTGYYDPVLLSLQSAKFIEIADTEEVVNSFELQAEGEGEVKSVIFLFPSAEVKKDWAKEIKTIIRFYQKQRLLSSRKN